MNLTDLVTRIRSIEKKYVLLFAYNGTGKTRLSMAFKEAGKIGDNRDTLYFNAFTEDLFNWDNDIESDTERKLILNVNSQFFNGLRDLDMTNKIRPLLHRYANFDFDIDYDTGSVIFEKDELINGRLENIENIKISRGEENVFIWCFFLAVAQLAIDKQPGYDWVNYLYIDDPISSLDDNNTIAVAAHLAQMLKKEDNQIKTIISSHHTLFFNVMCNELKRAERYFLSKIDVENYVLTDTTDTPFFHHVSLIKDLHNAVETGNLFTYHFNILRSILEKTASFHAFKYFSDCIMPFTNDEDGVVHKRMINILSHGNYSLFEPREMLPENKIYFKTILKNFIDNYHFNPEIIPELSTEEE